MITVFKPSLLLLLSFLIAVVCGAEFYSINWDQVATTETVIKPKDLVKCLCDLTFFQCDANCCCDNDCSASEKQLFSECVPFGEPPDDTICVDASDVSVVNRVSANIKNGQLCVVKNNNPSLGLFFTDAKPVTAVSFGEISSSKNRFGFDDVARDFSAVSPSSSSSNYKVGDEILQVSTPKKPFPLPTTNVFGYCSDSNPAVFMSENQSYTCTVYSPNMPTDCATLFSLSKYTQFTIAKTPVDTEGTPIVVTSVNGVAGASLPSSSYSSSTCTNALQKVEYLVVHNGAGGIVNVSVQIWTTSVPDWGTNLGASLSQSFSIHFINDTPTSGVVRDKSGNPGYLLGKPVLFGNSTSNDGIMIKQAILQPTSPLTLLGASVTGTCQEGAGPLLTFGDDVLVGCKLAVPATLLDSCQDFSNSIMIILRNNIPTYVGKYGNANYMNIYDWASVYEALPEASVLNSAGGFCTNIPNGIEYKIITTFAGPLKAPQATILAASVNYSSLSLSPSSPSLQLYASVSFINIATTGSLQENLPAPPLMKPLPDDILYPFKLSLSSPPIHASFLLLSLSLLFCIL